MHSEVPKRQPCWGPRCPPRRRSSALALLRSRSLRATSDLLSSYTRLHRSALPPLQLHESRNSPRHDFRLFTSGLQADADALADLSDQLLQVGDCELHEPRLKLLQNEQRSVVELVRSSAWRVREQQSWGRGVVCG